MSTPAVDAVPPVDPASGSEATAPVPGVQRYRIDRTALVAGELWCCIVQSQRSEADISADHSTQAAIDTVTALLKTNESGFPPLDDNCDNPNFLRLVLLPELSLSFTDWERVDVAVKGYPRSVLLVAGFGFTKAATLRPHVPFLPPNITDERNVNYGCAWFKSPAGEGTTAQHHTVYFCKNFPEQKTELPQYDSVPHSDILALEFDDLLVCPLLCSDLVATTQHQKKNPIDRIKSHASTLSPRPTLITGSLRDTTPWHAIWAAGMTRAIDAPSTLLIIANAASAARPSSFDHDLPRNLSGVYTAVAHHKERPACTSWSSIRHEHTLTGSPIRDCTPLIVAGTLRLADYSATTGRHLWRPRWGKELSGTTLKPAIDDRVHYEWPRLLARTRHAAVSNAALTLDELQAHLAAAPPSRALQLLKSLLLGPFPSSASVDPCRDADLNRASEYAIRSVDSLKRAPRFEWPIREDVPLSVLLPPLSGAGHDESVDVHVWRSGTDDWRVMTQALLAHAEIPKAGGPLILFAADRENIALDVQNIHRPREATRVATELDTPIDIAVPRANTNPIAVLPLDLAGKLSVLLLDTPQFEAHAQEILKEITEQLLGELS